ncbi:MAG: hypothetical protein M1814_001482 [Vezdaea aestivalis]|nr:MAG: hypothetical protein M1814_001482 [Vezdaea aestivalis]
MVLQHTASNTLNTIWKPISEESFMRAVREVFISSKQTAGAFRVYDHRPQLDHTTSFTLPFEIEFQLAQDFAFIAAYEEGAKTVSAVSVTPQATGRGIAVTISANHGVSPFVRTSLEEISSVLERCAKKEFCSKDCAEEELFDLVIKLDKSKIVSRLKSELWKPPNNFEKRPPPLCECLLWMHQNVSRTNPSQRTNLKLVSQKIHSLSSLVTAADSGGFQPLCENLKGIVRLVGDFAGSDISLEHFFERKRIQTTKEDKKAVNALDKLGNYWRLCRRLCRFAMSKRYRSSFVPIRLAFLDQHSRHKINGLSRYVHAEVQLVVFHRQHKDSPKPRVIGTSKAACYLCDLFLSHHPQYTISATHGMLYEQWTIPDLPSYDLNDRQEIQNMIRAMFQTLVDKTASQPYAGMTFPVQSGIYQPYALPNLTATTFSLTNAIIKGKSSDDFEHLGVDNSNVREDGTEERDELSNTPYRNPEDTGIAPSPIIIRPSSAGSDIADPRKLQSLFNAPEQQTAPDKADESLPAPVAVKNFPKRINSPDTPKFLQNNTRDYTSDSAPNFLTTPAASLIEASNSLIYSDSVSKQSSSPQFPKYKLLPHSRRHLISISGPPGSGKTTLASALITRLNALHASTSPGSATTKIAACISQDGFHLPRSALAQMPDPELAFARRGAEWTFDVAGLLRCVREVRRPLTAETKTVRAPGFDHAAKDPVEEAVLVSSKVKVVVFEGNYLADQRGLWGEVGEEMDEVWVLEVDEERAARRLVDRHLRSGIVGCREEGERRVEENDAPNGREILRERGGRVDEVVRSVEDEGWRRLE